MIDYHYHASSVDSIKRRHAVIRLHVSDNNSNMLNLNVLLLTCAMVALSSSQDARTMQQPLDFIQEVFSNLTKDGEGRPKDLETGPTSVWFLQDTGKFCTARVCMYVCTRGVYTCSTTYQ